MVELEAAAGPDPRGHAPESAVVKDHARTPNRPRTPIRPPVLLASRAPAAAVPASRCPCVLRAPPPGLRASAVAPPPPVSPAPGARPRPLPPVGWAAVGRWGREDTITPGRQAGVCARMGVPALVPAPLLPEPRGPTAVPPLLLQLGRCGGAGGGGTGSAPAPRGR